MKLIVKTLMSKFHVGYLARMCYEHKLSKVVGIIYDIEKIMDDIWNEINDSYIRDIRIELYGDGNIHIVPITAHIYSYEEFCDCDFTDLSYMVNIFKRYYYNLKYVKWDCNECVFKLTSGDSCNDPVEDCLSDRAVKYKEITDFIDNMYNNNIVPKHDFKPIVDKIVRWVCTDRDNLIGMCVESLISNSYCNPYIYYDEGGLPKKINWMEILDANFDGIIEKTYRYLNWYLSYESNEVKFFDKYSVNPFVVEEINLRVEYERRQKRANDFIYAFEKHEKKLIASEKRKLAKLERQRMKFRDILISEMMEKWKLEDEHCETCGGRIYLHNSNESFRAVKFTSGIYKNQVAIYIGNGLESYKEFHWGRMKNYCYRCWNYNRNSIEYDGCEKSIHYFYNKKLGIFKSNIDYTVNVGVDFDPSEVIDRIMDKVEQITHSIYTEQRTSSFTDALQFLDGCFFDKKLVHKQLNEILKRELIRLPELFRKLVKTNKDHIRVGTTKRWIRDFLRASYVRSITYEFAGKIYTELVKSERRMFTYTNEFILNDDEIENIIFAS